MAVAIIAKACHWIQISLLHLAAQMSWDSLALGGFASMPSISKILPLALAGPSGSAVSDFRIKLRVRVSCYEIHAATACF